MSRAGQSVLRHLRRAAVLGDEIERSDVELLNDFVRFNDQCAFGLLVRRHGSMVLSVCRRVVGNHTEADDAFQAAFLVLARKAAGLDDPDLLGNWLYGVAYRTALEARTRMLRRTAAERPLIDVPSPVHEQSADNSELLALLDRELSRLADKYRVPVVLCELEGRSRKEVANLLGIPEGTLSSRLAAARKLLAARLTRRGAAVSAAGLGVYLTHHAALASVPAPLLESTVAGAVASSAIAPSVAVLMKGALQTMFLKKLQLSALLLAVLGLGTGVVTIGVVGGKTAVANPDEKPKPGGPTASASLQGGWTIESLTVGGKDQTDGPAKLNGMYFLKDKGYLVSPEGAVASFTYKVDTSPKPAHLDLEITADADERKNKMAAIFELKGDALQICLLDSRDGGEARPTALESKEGSRLVLIKLKRSPDMKEPDPKTTDDRVKQAADRMRSANNLKQIGLAFHNYHDSMRALPGAAVYNKDGKPLLSWRVLILPYIEQDALYRQFKLDEPWDSDHNKKLIDQMPAIYGKGKETHYRVFTGKGTAFDGTNGLKFGQFTDGLSNTLLVVEAVDKTTWTKPDELEYDAEKPLPKLGGKPFENGFQALLCDGSVRFMSIKTPEKTLRALITRDGGETIEDKPE